MRHGHSQYTTTFVTYHQEIQSFLRYTAVLSTRISGAISGHGAVSKSSGNTEEVTDWFPDHYAAQLQKQAGKINKRKISIPKNNKNYRKDQPEKSRS